MKKFWCWLLMITFAGGTAVGIGYAVDYKEKYDEQVSNNVTLEQEVKNLKAENEELKDSSVVNASEITDLKLLLSQAQENLSVTVAQKEALESELETKSIEITSLQTTLTETESEIETLEGEITEKDNQLAAKQAELEEVQNSTALTIEEKEAKITELNSEIETLTSEKAQLQSDYDSLNETYNATVTELEDLRAMHAIMSQERNAANTIVNNQKIYIEELEAQIEELEASSGTSEDSEVSDSVYSIGNTKFVKVSDTEYLNFTGKSTLSTDVVFKVLDSTTNTSSDVTIVEAPDGSKDLVGGDYTSIEVAILKDGYSVIYFKNTTATDIVGWPGLVYFIYDGQNKQISPCDASYVYDMYHLDDAHIMFTTSFGISMVLDVPTAVVNKDTESTSQTYSTIPTECMESNTGLKFFTSSYEGYPGVFVWDTETATLIQLSDVGNKYSITAETETTITLEGVDIQTAEKYEVVYDISSKTATGDIGSITFEEEVSVPTTFSEATPSQISYVSNNISANNMTSEEIYSTYGWSIGDTTSITLTTGEVIQMRIIGFNHDDKSDGTGKAGITLEMVHCLATQYIMNSEMTNAGGYAASVLKTETLPAIKATLPEEWQSVIKMVDKKSANGGSSNYSETLTLSEDIFLLSQIEVFGTTSAQDGANEGIRYEYYNLYPNSSKRMKKRDTNADGVVDVGACWWLRSCNSSDTLTLSYVDQFGSSANGNPTYLYGVSFAFCI